MQEMTDAEIQEAIGRARVGILALARDDRSYAFPLFFAYDDGTFYWHSHPGEKEAYIHETEEACLTLVRGFDKDDWVSVMAFGQPEAIWDEQDVEEVTQILDDVPPPPELGEDEEGQPQRSEKGAVYWRMPVDRMTGRKSQPGSASADPPG